jgi:ATP-dependent RNA helicase DDX24/MAK5
MATDKKGLLALAKAAKARQAARRIAARKRAAADTTEDQVELELDSPVKKKSKKSLSKEERPKKRLRADQLQWREVKTSSLPGMDAGGGMMMLEELDGVGVEWEEGVDGGRTAKFVVSEAWE